MEKRRKITIGILAHVDSGKTTLTEGILFKCGVIRKVGRVDYGDAFLDTDVQEKERGITIFSKQVQISLPSLDVTILDTPGHVDFSAEMERTLQVLDYAVLVINGREGIQGHDLTLWKLIKKYDLPVIVFVNKMDLCARDGDEREAKAKVMEELKRRLGNEFVDFSSDRDVRDRDEEIATCDEEALDEFLQAERVENDTIAKAIKAGSVIPCYFGAALKMEGIDELLNGMNAFCNIGEEDKSDEPFSARVFKITRDKQGERLTHLKVLSGLLKTKKPIGPEEKINQIRIYSGEKFTVTEEAEPGTVCSVTGLKDTYAGQWLQDEEYSDTSGMAIRPELEAALSYSVMIKDGTAAHDAYRKLRELEEEDPQLKISWDEKSQTPQVCLMGKVQLEILKTIIAERFGMEVEFGEGKIAYRETIAQPVEGAGHFEPLRHYAEVHLLMEPLPRGSGIVIDTACSEDDLDKNWQRLIFTHLVEREHPGVLTGSPITDMKITLTGGRAHLKHTEGGDFRQATYRAIRQGLRKSLAAGNAILLEPWYEFTLQIPQDMVGRAMADIQRMGGVFDDPDGDVLTGKAPVSEMQDYATEVASYTRGFGHLTCRTCGYEECHDTQAVLAGTDYDADRDVDNPADSVFCSHGAGHNVPWDEADEMMHVRVAKATDAGDQQKNPRKTISVSASGGGKAVDKELDEIFERTYGRLKKESKKKPVIEAKTIKAEKRKKETYEDLPEYLLVDGYNIIFAWDELKELAKENIDSAREALIDILSNYQGYKNCNLIAVFDAYKVKGGERHIEKADNITVVYTKEAETADTYIERTAYELANKKYNVRVATSDRLEQMIIIGNDARKVSANDFKKEVEQVEMAISQWIEQHNRKNRIDNPNKIVIEESNKEKKEV